MEGIYDLLNYGLKIYKLISSFNHLSFSLEEIAERFAVLEKISEEDSYFIVKDIFDKSVYYELLEFSGVSYKMKEGR